MPTPITRNSSILDAYGYAFPDITLEDFENSAHKPWAPKARDFHKPLWDQSLWLTANVGDAVIVTKSSNYSLLSTDTGKQFTGPVTFTLPDGVAIPANGKAIRFGFIVPVGGTLGLAVPAGNTLRYGPNTIAASTTLTAGTFGTTFWAMNFALHTWLIERHTGTPLSLP